MRTFVVPATLLLTACTSPGATGTNSFMAAMHPSQEFCASHGLTLDPTTKQCVTAPAPAPSETTGSLPAPTAAPDQQHAQPKAQPSHPPQSQQQPGQPQPPPPQAQPQQAQPQERRVGSSVPIESDVNFEAPQIAEAAVEFAHFVRASGYRCDSISALAPRPRGFTLACNRSTFEYAIENKGGRWIVTVQ